MPFASLSLTSVLAYMGSLLVPLGSSMRAGIGNAAVNAAEFTSSSLSLKEGNGFGRLVWLTYNPAKHVLTGSRPILGLCGVARQGRSKWKLRASTNAWIWRGDLC